jgi:hypothetical protein
MCHNGSKVESKFDKHHIARLPHPVYSPDLSPCDFWLFGIMKEILKNREFRSHDEIEEAITMAWNDLKFDEAQSVFHNWMNRLRWSLRTGESGLLNKDGSVYLCLLSDRIGEVRGLSLPPLHRRSRSSQLRNMAPNSMDRTEPVISLIASKSSRAS